MSDSHGLLRKRRLACAMDQSGQAAARSLVSADYVLHGPSPLNDVHGPDAFSGDLLRPLLTAFPSAEERVDVLLTGQFAGGDWTATRGHICGLFVKSLWGIRPTGAAAFLPFGRFDRWVDGLMTETFLILDLPALMMASGVWPIAMPLGPVIPAPGPRTLDGVTRDAGDAAEARQSLDLVEAMIAGLMTYDGGSDLAQMGMVRFWTPDFWWFGPAAIGSFRGHRDYERGHQWPFLHAFPDRKGGDHKCRIGERTYIASTGWPSIRATHTGGGWLGMPPTGRRVGMRVMDFWRRDGGLLAENWVFIDIPDLLLQLGVDVFERMRTLPGAERRDP